MHIQQLRNQSENYYIIENIITYSLYSPYYVTKTSANGSAVSLYLKFRQHYL